MANMSHLSQYGGSFQTKIIGTLLTDREFLITISNALSEDYFENVSHQWIIKNILSYYNKYHTVPSMDFLKAEVQKIDNEITKIAIKEQLIQAYREADQIDIPYIKDEFLSFCKNQQIKKAIMTSAELLGANEFDSIRQIMLDALKIGENRSLGHEYEKDIEARYREDDRRPIPFPWKVFNDNTQGGKGKGDLVIIFGNPGGGKSWSIIDMAAHDVKLGYNVLYFTLELSENYVGKRLDASFLNIPVDQISHHRKEIEDFINTLPGKIRIKEFPAGKTSLDDLETHTELLRDQLGFEPHVIYIDYLDLLKNSSKDKLEGTEEVYTNARGWARELKIPIVSPAQANRSGAKMEIIEGDNISGSYSKLMIGDIVISLTRNRKDKLNGTGRWHFMKNRFGPDGMTFGTKIDTSTGHIEVFEDMLDIKDQPPAGVDNGRLDKDEKTNLKKFLAER